MKGIAVLGSTGSIGINTLDVIARHPDRFRVIALAANQSIDVLEKQCNIFNPATVAMANEACALQLQERLANAGLNAIEVLSGMRGVETIASLKQVDVVMAAIVGAKGLLPTLAGIRSGKTILLANKESLVMAGPLFMAETKHYKATLLPIDSEHNAIFQCLPLEYAANSKAHGVKKIILTASGGPFRETPIEQLHTVTPDQACNHPNWVMGRKISVDSATMMNKGLELIEACWLFQVPPEQVQICIHPQSIVHSMVAFVDGTVLAQLGQPDMRIPIAHALGFPDRIESGAIDLDICALSHLHFETPDLLRFPCLDLAFQAMKTGGTATAILNAANEIAVDAFLHNRIAFTAISKIIETTLTEVSHHDISTLETVLQDDTRARQTAKTIVETMRFQP